MKRFLRVFICCILALAVLAPVDADGARRKRRAKATSTATTKAKSTASTSKKKTSRRKKSSSSGAAPASTAVSQPVKKTVTQATQDVAKSASHVSSTAKDGNKSPSGLKKITVDKPDLEEVRTSTLDPRNKYYFPKLMAKYLQNDTTMTPEEYRYLYLGYMFQEDYDPYRTSPYSEMTDSFRFKEQRSRAEIDTVRKYAEKALLDNPFDLRQMSFLVHVLKERRKDMSAKIWEYRLEHLLGAIKSTGTGEDEDNAWYVIYPMHEYDIVQLLGYEAVDVEYIEPGYDKLIVEPDGSVKHRKPAQAFYFNVQVPQQQYELKHPEEAEELEDDISGDLDAIEEETIYVGGNESSEDESLDEENGDIPEDEEIEDEEEE